MIVLVTGAAGFVGYHVAAALLDRGETVIGVDSIGSYYDPRLKQARLAILSRQPAFTFHRIDIADRQAMEELASRHQEIDHVVHLAAQAGVRHSLIDPFSYVQSNVMGQLVVLEVARRLPHLRHVVYASSSSVYGANRKLPFAETDRVDSPMSVYAASKRADELMSHCYAHLFGVPQSGLRFFTVYGPWGRPDMAYYSFARAIMAGEIITLYDDGRLKRDFTYIDDIVAGVIGCLERPPEHPTEARLFNIGNHRSESVNTLVALLEESLGRKAAIRTAARPETEVEETYASIDRIAALTGFAPSTPLAVGIPRFAAWFLDWHRSTAAAPGQTG